MFDDEILIENQQVRQFLSHPLGQLVPPPGTNFKQVLNKTISVKYF